MRAGHIPFLAWVDLTYQRKRLIDHRVPFIVPGNQLYLPSFGMDLREFYRKLHETPETFSPAAQVVLLYLLLRAPTGPHTPNELAKRLGSRYTVVYPASQGQRMGQMLSGYQISLIDTPGVITFPPHSDDEKVTAQVLPPDRTDQFINPSLNTGMRKQIKQLNHLRAMRSATAATAGHPFSVTIRSGNIKNTLLKSRLRAMRAMIPTG